MRAIALAVLLLAVPSFAADGRWQIVNPTPSVARDTMLIDTQTGETWILCVNEEGGSNWCFVPKTKSRDRDVTKKEKSSWRELPNVPPTP